MKWYHKLWAKFLITFAVVFVCFMLFLIYVDFVDQTPTSEKRYPATDLSTTGTTTVWLTAQELIDRQAALIKELKAENTELYKLNASFKANEDAWKANIAEYKRLLNMK